MDSAVAALIGAGIGAGAGVAGQLLAVRYASQNERRRVAVDAAIREWERQVEFVTSRGGGAIYPSAYFVYFTTEIIRVVESRGGLTADRWRDLMRKAAEVRRAIEEESAKREAE